MTCERFTNLGGSCLGLFLYAPPRRGGLPTASLFGVLGGRGRLTVGALVPRFPGLCGFQPGGLSDSPNGVEDAWKAVLRAGHAATSSDSEKLILDETKSDDVRNISIKTEGADCVQDVGAQFLPRITLSNDGFGQTLGDEAAVRLLCDLEEGFGVHNPSVPPRKPPC